jgi:hypothetical protein
MRRTHDSWSRQERQETPPESSRHLSRVLLFDLLASSLFWLPSLSALLASYMSQPSDDVDLSALSPSQLSSVAQFRQITNVDDVSSAVDQLQSADWSVERALENIYDPPHPPSRPIEQLEIDDSDATAPNRDSHQSPRSRARGTGRPPTGLLWIFALGRHVRRYLDICESTVLTLLLTAYCVSSPHRHRPFVSPLQCVCFYSVSIWFVFFCLRYMLPQVYVNATKQAGFSVFDQTFHRSQYAPFIGERNSRTLETTLNHVPSVGSAR